MSIIGDLRGLAQAGKDIMSAKTRPLTKDEITEAKTVFLETINFDRVQIADRRGYNNRPFTLYNSVVNRYTLFLGPTAFPVVPAAMYPTLIHELTHVWQGQNHVIGAGYMINSVIAQAIDGGTAYDYTVGDYWGEYNVEQQAHLVEDWYDLDKKSEASVRFPYIKNDIRNPLRGWASDLFIGAAAGAAQVKG